MNSSSTPWIEAPIAYDIERGVAKQIARPATEAAGAVVGVVELASFQGEAAAADAFGQFVAERHEQPDPLVEFGVPAARESLPVALVGCPPGRERLESFADLVQGQPDALSYVDKGQATQHVAVIAPLVSSGPLRLDQPLALVKPESRRRHAGPGGCLADG